MAITLEKVKELGATARISLAKAGLGKEKFKVVLALDVSGSMTGQYDSGAVEETVARVLGLARELDDDGSIEVIVFGNGSRYFGNLAVENASRSVQKLWRTSTDLRSGTEYAGVINFVCDWVEDKLSRSGALGRFFGKKESPVPERWDGVPVYLLLVTDGDNNQSDKEPARRALIRASGLKVFLKCIGISKKRFEFLKEMDSLKGRIVDNASFTAIEDPSAVDPAWLYDQLGREVPEWLSGAKQKGIMS